jgi:cobyrinic acid a,c-diamide synthase
MKHTENSAENLENEFIYTPAGTCITIKWRHLGWIPASEDPAIQAKWAAYQALHNRSLADSTAPVK